MGIIGQVPEIDLLELGERAAKALRAENTSERPSDWRARLVAGRAYKGLNWKWMNGNRAFVVRREPYWFEQIGSVGS